MTTATRARCDYCGTDVPTGETFRPVPGGALVRCRDVEACGRRQLLAYDPSLLRDEDLPVPPPAGAPAGAACEVCRATAPPGGLYERVRGQWHCRDRRACEQRGVEAQYLNAWSDSSPDRLITPAHMRAMAAAARPEIGPEPEPLDPARMAALAAQDRLGRKRNEGR